MQKIGIAPQRLKYLPTQGATATKKEIASCKVSPTKVN